MSSLTLYPYQTEAVAAFKDAGRRGSLIYATGTGKTEIAIGIIDQFFKDFPNGKTVFIVPRIVLIHQTAQRLSGYGFPSTPYFGEEKDMTGKIVVSTYQSLCKVNELEGLVRGWLREFGNVLFVFDEVHLASDEAENYVSIMKGVKDFIPDRLHMLALTATIDEEAEKNAVILETCPIISRIMMGEAIEKGFLSDVKVIDASVNLTAENQGKYEYLIERIKQLVIEMGTSNPTEIKRIMFSYGELKYSAMGWFKAVNEKTKILNFDPNKIHRAKEIINTENVKTLVFAERVMALQLMSKAINDPAKFKYIEAKTPAKKRAEIIEEFRTGKLLALGTVHTLDIGFDQKDVKNCVFIASNKNDNQLIQRLGRGVRKAEGKAIAKIFVIYAKSTGEREVINMINRAVEDGRTGEPIKEEPKVPEPPFMAKWSNGGLSISGKTYSFKEIFKQNGFGWNPDAKTWVRYCREEESVEIMNTVKKLAGIPF